jgi:putative Ca2+/H+ antiporter (TMEM165/GDT1 family)
LRELIVSFFFDGVRRGGRVTAFLASLVFVVLAEMGDKTQLLAMAFATRFRTSVVLWGVFVATALNHLLAVAAGNYLTKFVPMHHIQLAAAGSFILFGLWTIRGDKLEGRDKKYTFSPFWTVATAFFIAEMGDKTQLSTVALAVKYQTLLPVWLGTTMAMIIADAFGIIVGIVLGKRIPEQFVKWGSACVFVAFGVFGIHENVSEQILTPVVEVAGLTALVLIGYLVAHLTLPRARAILEVEE